MMKSLEKIVIEELRGEVEPFLGTFQFVYARNRSTNDAVSTILRHVLKHLHTRLLFTGFSSAFLNSLTFYLGN